MFQSDICLRKKYTEIEHGKIAGTLPTYGTRKHSYERKRLMSGVSRFISMPCHLEAIVSEKNENLGVQTAKSRTLQFASSSKKEITECCLYHTCRTFSATALRIVRYPYPYAVFINTCIYHAVQAHGPLTRTTYI